MKPRTQIALPLIGLSGLLALFLSGWVTWRLYTINPALPKMYESPAELAALRDAFSRIGGDIRANLSQLDAELTPVTPSKLESPKNVALGKTANQAVSSANQLESWNRWLEVERQLARRPDRSLGSSNQTGGLQSPGAYDPDQLRTELLTLLSDFEAALTNFLEATNYLRINRSGPLIGERLAKQEINALYWRSKLSDFPAQARARAEAVGQAITAHRSAQENAAQQVQESAELVGYIQRLRLTGLLAVVGLCFLFLLGLYLRKQSLASAALRQHSERQANLDKFDYFRSQQAQEHAHEIKQPLTAINAHLYTLQKSLTVGSAAHKDATIIRSEITRLDQIVQKFLQLARSTAAQPIDLTAGQALGEVRDLMAPQLAQQAIELRFEVDRDAEFRADPQQFKQVLINLVKNATESIAREGVITLRAKTGAGELNGNEAAVTIIEVEDTGPGIPEEIREKIFDPFFSTKPRGSGLGLATSARMIEQHGGRLEFDSQVGRGTIFRIVLPTLPKEPRA